MGEMGGKIAFFNKKGTKNYSAPIYKKKGVNRVIIRSEHNKNLGIVS